MQVVASHDTLLGRFRSYSMPACASPRDETPHRTTYKFRSDAFPLQRTLLPLSNHAYPPQAIPPSRSTLIARLFLFVVIDLVIPTESNVSTREQQASPPIQGRILQCRLVSIAPKEVLRPNVLIRVLHPLLQRRHM